MADTTKGEFVTEYVHDGIDLVKLAAKHGLRHWRCRACGQWETVKVGEDPKPCFRCDLNSGAYQRRLDEMRRIGDAKRAKERMTTDELA